MLKRVLVASIALTALAGEALAGKADDTLNVAFSNEVTTLDNYKETTREGLIVARLIYDSLISKDMATGEFKPELAKSYRVVDDKTLEFEIRDGVKFHNGAALTADDVVYTLNLVTTKEYGARYRIAVDWIDKAEKVGDRLVRLTMKSPYPLALEMLAGNLPIYPKAYFEQVGSSGMAVKPVGTGPYKLTEITPGTRFVLERFEDYYQGSPKGRPAIRKVVIRVLPEANIQYAELIAGQVDWIWRVPPDEARNLARQKNVEIKPSQIMRFAYLAINPNYDGGKSPLAKLEVRRALNHAVDRAAIAKAFVGGASQVIHSACNPLQFGCATDVTKYDFDAAKAKQMLTAAGLPEGYTLDLGVGANPRPQAEAIAANLAKAGLKVTLNEQQSAPLLTAWREGKVPLMFFNWGSYGVGDVGLSVSQFFQGNNDDVVKDKQLIEWIKIADSSLDRGVRAENYKKALQRVAEQAYWIPLWTFNVNVGQSKDLEFSLDADEFARFYQAKWK